ncbi:TetR/AcrR family transcriptional regulator [Amycolatopsis cihanbeyliensis]|uniref:TetR family transcriptional regulator n=1 Tax=Amycolatopsis cihanbeyliensis TaxID=1128664 RepID=A0A542DS24_AMYCI|nr:TetR/AcrR family transcriptional regulator [Amycolatopsis cihanbeyliensis]TQJ05933.1 TetR family transcriptional regulator [Amycolatopsis cihanbeyliensis]
MSERTATGVEAFAAVGQRLPSRHRLTADEVAASQRARILVAFLEIAAEKGYPSVTIADIVERAGVSRQAFYHLFPTKHACFVAAFRAGSAVALGEINRPLSELPYTDWRGGIQRAMEKYLTLLAEHPKATWALQIECLAAGPEVAAMYHRRVAHLAELYRLTYNHVIRKEHPDRPILPDEAFDLVVGGMSDRIRYCLYTRGAEAIPELAPVFFATLMTLFGEQVDSADPAAGA